VHATVVDDRAVAVGGKEEHLILPGIGVEWPTVAEDYRLSCAPILVVDLCTVLRREHDHGFAPFSQRYYPIVAVAAKRCMTQMHYFVLRLLKVLLRTL
jgi:hypothetical protein